MEDIPEDILAQILTHFSVNKLLIDLNRVSKRYNELISTDSRLWRRIIPNSSTLIKDITFSLNWHGTTYANLQCNFKIILNSMHFTFNRIKTSKAMQFIKSKMNDANDIDTDDSNDNKQRDIDNVDNEFEKNVISLNSMNILLQKRTQWEEYGVEYYNEFFEKFLNFFFSKYDKKYCKKFTSSIWSSRYGWKLNAKFVAFIVDFQVTILDIQDYMIPNFTSYELNRLPETISFDDVNIKHLIVNGTSSYFSQIDYFSMLRMFKENSKKLETIEIVGLFQGQDNIRLSKMKQMIVHFPLAKTLKNVYWTNPPEYDGWLDTLFEQTIKNNCPHIVNIKFKP